MMEEIGEKEGTLRLRPSEVYTQPGIEVHITSELNCSAKNTSC